MASVTDARYGHKDASDQNFDYMFKLLIIGNSSVGKTSFLFRYADDTFTPAFVSTVGIDFKVKTVYRNDKRVKLQIWSTRSTILCSATHNFLNSSIILPGNGLQSELKILQRSLPTSFSSRVRNSTRMGQAFPSTRRNEVGFGWTALCFVSEPKPPKTFCCQRQKTRSRPIHLTYRS
nr:ras-related protein Rab-3B isoform X3 [Zootoca vivipara]